MKKMWVVESAGPATQRDAGKENTMASRDNLAQQNTQASAREQVRKENSQQTNQESSPPTKSSTAAPNSIPHHARKTYFSIEEDHLLYERAQNQCEFTDPLTGTRCESRHLLQKDHIIPIAKGGTNDLDNLRLLCHTHNQLKAHHHFGAEFINEKCKKTKSIKANPIHHH